MTMSPILLLGAYTAAFGASNEEIHSQSNWKSQKVGNSLHCILEACEPSIGLRLEDRNELYSYHFDVANRISVLPVHNIYSHKVHFVPQY